MTLTNSQAGLFAALAYQAQNVAHGYSVGPEAVVNDTRAFKDLLDTLDKDVTREAAMAMPTASTEPATAPADALQLRADFNRDNAADLFADRLYSRDGIWYSKETDRPVVFTPYGYVEEEQETAPCPPSSQSSPPSSQPSQSSPSSPADTSSITTDSPDSSTAPNTAALSAVTPPQ